MCRNFLAFFLHTLLLYIYCLRGDGGRGLARGIPKKKREKRRKEKEKRTKKPKKPDTNLTAADEKCEK